MEVMPKIRFMDFYGFIPLNYEDGIYKLIDILPLLKEKDRDFENVMTYKNESGIRNIDFAAVAVEYICNHANILVTKVNSDDTSKQIDEKLQEQYYPLIYNGDYDKNKIKKCSKDC